MYAAINVSKEYMRESLHFFTSVQEFFVLNGRSKKSNYFKNPISPDPFVSYSKVSPDKSNNKPNKGYGSKNGFMANCTLTAPTH